jgi:hypothetical protein
MIQSKNNFMRSHRNGLLLFLAVLLISLFSINAEAVSPDTVSSADVSFTAVPPPVVKYINKKTITKVSHKQQQFFWRAWLAALPRCSCRAYFLCCR